MKLKNYRLKNCKKVYSHKNRNSIYNVNIDRTVVWNKVSFCKKGFKYFIGYENNYEKVMPLCIMLTSMSTYRKNFAEIRYLSFW